MVSDWGAVILFWVLDPSCIFPHLSRTFIGLAPSILMQTFWLTQLVKSEIEET